jgi:hypothetical protein
MDSVRGAAHEEKHIWRNLSDSPIYAEHKNDVEEVDKSKDVLAKTDIVTMISQPIQSRKDVNETSRVNKWSGVASKFGVVIGPIYYPLYFLHICLPVDFSIFDIPDNPNVYKDLEYEQRHH